VESLTQAGRSVAIAVLLGRVGLSRHNLNLRTTVMTDDKIALRGQIHGMGTRGGAGRDGRGPQRPKNYL
jgi:hypothetical protein